MMQIQHGQRLHVLSGCRAFVLCQNGSLLDRLMMLRFTPQRLRERLR